jgi:hypothetical protein
VTASASGANEIVAFTKMHPPVMVRDVDWGDSSALDLTFEPERKIRIQFWILHKTQNCDFNCQSTNAGFIVSRANKIFREERTGIQLEMAGDPVDLTTTVGFEPLVRFSQPDDCDSAAFDSLTQAHKTTGALNMYVVSTVGGVSTRGTTCLKMDTAFVASRVAPGTGAHEIGHNLGLSHPCGCLDLMDNDFNLMHPASDNRKFLAEGQVYWMHFSKFSALPEVLNVHSGLARHCTTSTPNLMNPCPKIEMRIWPD